MRTKIYLLVVIALLVACNDQSQNIAAETLSTARQKSTLATEVTVAKKVNIKDVFLLLPSDVFPLEDISVTKRELLFKHIGEEQAYDISATPIEIYDPRNGFLSLTGMQFAWEMSYWNLQDGRKLVAVNKGTETGSEIRVFFYHNGKLSEDHNYQLGGNQHYKLTDFVDLAQLSVNTRKRAQEQFAKGAYHLYYQLPQQGTSLKVSLDTDQLLDNPEADGIPEDAIKEVILKWKNEQWVR